MLVLRILLDFIVRRVDVFSVGSSDGEATHADKIVLPTEDRTELSRKLKGETTVRKRDYGMRHEPLNSQTD